MIEAFNNYIQKLINKGEAQIIETGNKILMRLWEDLIDITPEIVAATAIFSGGWIILSPLIDERPLIKPLGIFGAVFAVGASVIIAS